jgi:hypothetical protein
MEPRLRGFGRHPRGERHLRTETLMPTHVSMGLLKAVMAAVAVVPAVERRRQRKGKLVNRSTAPAWADDRLGYWPVHDRGGSMSDFQVHEQPGMLGALARIELNEEDQKKDIFDGVPKGVIERKSE